MPCRMCICTDKCLCDGTYVRRKRGGDFKTRHCNECFFLALPDKELSIPALPLLIRCRYKEGRTLSWLVQLSVSGFRKAAVL